MIPFKVPDNVYASTSDEPITKEGDKKRRSGTKEIAEIPEESTRQEKEHQIMNSPQSPDELQEERHTSRPLKRKQPINAMANLVGQKIVKSIPSTKRKE